MPRISIIIPVYNNSGIIDAGLTYLKKCLDDKKYDYEIVIVDDGSKDCLLTETIVNKYNFVLIKLDKNQGKGAAVKKGMLNSRGIIKIFTDDDVPYNFESIENIINVLESGDKDIAVGDRTYRESEYYRNQSFIRNLGSRFFSLLIGHIFKTGIKDTQCGLKGFTGDSADFLFRKSHINGFAFDAELLYLAAKYDYRVQKIQVEPRKSDSSSVRVLKHGLLMIIDLVKIKIYQIKKMY